MKKTKIALFCALLAAVTVTAARANNFEYDWTGGAAGYSGTIILDSDSSAHGSLANIVSGQVTTPQGTFAFDPSTVLVNGMFSWNADQINYLFIVWKVGAYQLGFGENWTGAAPNFVGSKNTVTGIETADFTGSWTAHRIPDSSSTVLLCMIGLACLAFLKKRPATLA